MSRIFARSLAVGVLLAVTSVGGVVHAAAAPPPNQCKPTKGQPAYPPGQCKPKSINPGDGSGGDHETASSGEGQFDPGSNVTVEIRSGSISLGSVRARSNGEAITNFMIPRTLGAGTYEVVFSGTSFGAASTVRVAFQVSKNVSGQGSGSAAGTGGGTTSGASNGSGGGTGLPLTGVEIAGTSLLGMVLVGAGGAFALAGRRRRETLPAQ